MANGDFRKHRHGFRDFGQVGPVAEVANDEVADHPGAQMTQGRAQLRFIGAAGVDERAHVVAADRAVDAGRQAFCKPGTAIEHALQKARQAGSVTDYIWQHGRFE